MPTVLGPFSRKGGFFIHGRDLVVVVGWPIGSILVWSVLIIWEPERCLPAVRG